MKKLSRIVILVGLILWLFYDFSTANRSFEALYKSFVPEKSFDSITSATAKVAIVPSDDPELADPISRTSSSISYEQIEDMVRRAIDLAGGLDWFISPGDMVLIKPNIVEVEPSSSGVVTDTRVVKAVVKIVDEIDPGNKITNQVRMNSIIAGPDPVAVDHVCTRIMGLNPDDCEQITLAEKVGLGTNDPEAITVVGTPIEAVAKKFIKNPNKDAEFGQSNRTWLLKGPYSISGISDPIDHDFIENESLLAPQAGQDDWSEPIYFTDDRIDLGDYFDDPSNVVSYAFAYFDAPKDQEAELWIGSDDALKIYINGQVVYNFSGVRSYGKNDFVSEKVKANIKAGENTLLVKSIQKYGYYQFALNICEPESNPNYDGNRIWPLKFKASSNFPSYVNKQLDSHPAHYTLDNCYPNPFNSTTTISFDLPKSEYITIKIYNTIGQELVVLADGVHSAGSHNLLWNADGYPSGVYICTMNAGGPSTGSGQRFIASRKIILRK